MLEAKPMDLLPNGPLQMEGQEFATDSQEFDQAILTTNDIFPEDLITEGKPNGVLFGLGIGGVLAMIDHFEEGPEEIHLFDIAPEVVDAGQEIIHLLGSAQDFEHFHNENPYLGASPIVVDHIEKHYNLLHRLAQEDRITMMLADCFSPDMAEYMDSIKATSDGNRHLYYVTDAPQFGLDQMENVQACLENTWFVDTETPYNEAHAETKFTTVRATFGTVPEYGEEYRRWLR